MNELRKQRLIEPEPVEPINKEELNLGLPFDKYRKIRELNNRKPKEKKEDPNPVNLHINLEAPTELTKFFADWDKEILNLQVENIFTSNNDPEQCCIQLNTFLQRFMLR